MININLLPPELKMKRIEAKRNASLISICIIGIIVTIVVGIIAKSLESNFGSYLGTTKGNIEKDSATLNQYQDLQNMALLINDRWQTAQTVNKNRVFWSVVLQDMINSVPVNVQIENVAIKTDKTPNFVLQGNTTSEREIIKFKEKLEASSYFKNVSFKSSSLQTQTQTQTTPATPKLEFTLEFDLENKGEAAGVGR